MKLRNASFGAVALVLASAPVLGSGCGGSGTTSRGTIHLPADEAALLEFAPTDAFFVARLDMRELRSSSTWELVEARLATAREEERTLANGVDRVYVAVGGLIQAPPIPPAFDENGTYRTRPAWAPLAEGLQGKIPAGLIVVEGSAASLCRTIIDAGEQTADSHGLHYGAKDGVVLATRGDNLCLITYEPAFEHLLTHAGEPSGAARRLMAVARGGSLGVASMAFELDSPVFRNLVDTIGPPPDQEQVGSSKWPEITKGIFRVLLDGITATEWEVRSDRGGFESIARVQVTNRDRGIMWREFSAMYVQIADIVVSNIEMDETDRANTHRILSSVRFEAMDDGYVIRNEVSADLVSRIFENLAPTSQVPDVVEAVSGDVYQLPYSLSGEASDTIGRVEPLLPNLAQLDARERGDVLAELSRAYRFVGRVDDARTLLATNAADGANEGTMLPPTLYAELCALENELGRGEEARLAAQAGRHACTGDLYCDVVSVSLTACEAVAVASLGRVDDALAMLPRASEPQGDEPGVIYGLARARVLARGGRLAEAATTVANLCIGRSQLEACRDATILDAMIVARTTTSPVVLDEALGALEIRVSGSANQRRAKELELAFASIRCDAASRTAGSEPTSADACSATYSAVVEAYGESHPRTLVAAMASARAARARRDTATATRLLATIDGILPRLGPNAVERTERASLGGNAARRQPTR